MTLLFYILASLLGLLVLVLLVFGIGALIKMMRGQEVSELGNILVNILLVNAFVLFGTLVTYIINPNQDEISSNTFLPPIVLHRNTKDLDLKITLYDKFENEIVGRKGQLIGKEDFWVVRFRIEIKDKKLNEGLHIAGNTWAHHGEKRPQTEDGLIGRNDGTPNKIKAFNLNLTGDLADEYEIIYSGVFASPKGSTFSPPEVRSGEIIGNSAESSLLKLKVNIKKKTTE